MTQEEFIKVLKKKKYSYEIEGDQIVVTVKKAVLLRDLTSLPTGVEFSNGGNVNLMSLTSLPPGVVFNNTGSVLLYSLTSLPPDVKFNNEGNVLLHSLISISRGVVFSNEKNVRLDSLIGGWFNEWGGNIEGIDSKSLLNVTIKRGMFI